MVMFLYTSSGCKPDCPNRRPGCQTVECPTYRKMREKLEAIKEGRRQERNTMTKRSEAKIYQATNKLKRYR